MDGIARQASLPALEDPGDFPLQASFESDAIG
jgi:hypothetical protein